MRPTEPFRDEYEALDAHIEHIREAARAIPGLSIEDAICFSVESSSSSAER